MSKNSGMADILKEIDEDTGTFASPPKLNYVRPQVMKKQSSLLLTPKMSSANNRLTKKVSMTPM